MLCQGTPFAHESDGGSMTRSFASFGSISFLLVLAACGGSVTPGDPTGGTQAGTATTGGPGTTSSGTGGPTTTGGDTVGTSGTSGTGTSGTVTVGTSGTSGTSSTGPSTVSVGSTGPTTTTTGTCGTPGAGGAGGAGGAPNAAQDGGVSDANIFHSTVPLHESGAIFDAPPFRVAPPGSAMLLRYGDFPPVSGTTTGTSGSTTATTGGGPDPETQYLVFGDAPVSCGAPYGPGTCGHWRVLIGIPPNDFKVGLISLDCANVNAFFSATGPDRGGGDCSGGGGSFNHGWLEILKIDADGADVRLSGTWTFDFDANAQYRAPRCLK
jgi:hypothetical protein